MVRLDALGQATYESWTNPSVQYAWGDLWLGITSMEAISAAAIPWPYSIWPQPDQQGTRAADGKINVRVFKIIEADVSDFVIRDRVNSAIAYWQMQGKILLDWDGIIQPEPACDPDLDLCTLVLDLTDIRQREGVAEAVRRFRQPKGVHFVFVRDLASESLFSGETHAGTPTEQDPQTGKVRYTNVVISRREPGEHILTHELGHVFQLPHSLNPFNLMCAESLFCPQTPSDKLNEGQKRTAQENARRLQ